MKNVIRFLIISLTPIAILIAYTALHSYVHDYASRYYDMLPLIATVIAGYAFAGAAILLICKKVLKEPGETRIPFEFPVGIVLMIFPILYFFIPVPLPHFFDLIFSSGLPIIGLFLGVYIGLLIILLRRRSKVINQRKEAQDLWHPV